MNCYVLAGGRSSRMGRPKSEIELGGETFLERTIRIAQPVFDEVVIVTRPGSVTTELARTVYDDGEAFAPIFGVRRALEDSGDVRAWILGVDFPRMSTEVLRVLAEQFERSFAELYVPTWNGTPQMLCAGWAKTLTRELSRMIEDADYQLQRLLDKARSETLDEDELRARFRGEPFTNVNTPEELERVKKEEGNEQREENLSHVKEDGDVEMVDVGHKEVTRREATAESVVRLSSNTLDLLERTALPKGDVLTTAKIAGIMGAKRTSELIPMTHPLAIEKIDVDIEVDRDNERLVVTSTVRCSGKTGVEIEAMTACSIAALTIYDMCKSVEKGIVIEKTRLLSKSGGKSGEWRVEG